MYLLTFEPLTGALTMFAFQNLCITPRIRIIPRARVILRRHWDLFTDVVVSELSDPMVDALAFEPLLYMVVMATVLTLVWALHPPRKRLK
jgi:hypothetical protein